MPTATLAYAGGAVHIDELNVDGLFVKLRNTTEGAVNMASWRVVCTSGLCRGGFSSAVAVVEE